QSETENLLARWELPNVKDLIVTGGNDGLAVGRKSDKTADAAMAPAGSAETSQSARGQRVGRLRMGDGESRMDNRACRPLLSILRFPSLLLCQGNDSRGGRADRQQEDGC